jgi:glycosyltransferase involved in cell wall biosynthesis
VNISVIIPAYNAEKTLCRAIDSVLGQTTPVAEILLIDDGSTDGTAQVAQKYGAAIRYFHHENAGLAVARNRGIDQAKCEWIALLDADDEWLPHKVEAQVRVIEEHPDIKWASCHHEFVNTVTGRRVVTPIPQSLQEEIRCKGTVSSFDAQLNGVFSTPSGVIIHRSVFRELGGFDPEMRTGQDGDMWCRIALKYLRLAVCPEICWLYYVGNADALHRRGAGCRDNQLKSFCRNMRRAMELGPDVVNAFRPYARTKVVDYLIRAAGRVCFIDSDAIADAQHLFPLTMRERSLLRVLRSLPQPIAQRVVGRLSP